MINVFRPFWSFDITKTEAWLVTMAAKGYHLAQVKFGTSTFVFKAGESRESTYRICYDKTQAAPLSQTMIDDGWSKVFRYKGWHFVENQKPKDAIKTFPSREGIAQRNRTVSLLLGGISLYCVFSTLAIALVTLLVIFNDGTVEFVPSPFWALTAVYWIAVLLVLYSWIRITRSSRNLYWQGWDGSRRSQVTKPHGKHVVKWKFAWHYSPDKLESWLEKMELEGYNLQHVGKLGTNFYFTRGNSRRVKYCADYQNLSNQRYFEAHSDAGWKLMFTSFSGFMKWTLWAQEYEDGQQPPQMYSDNYHLLKHARRVAISHSCVFVPMILIYSFNIVMNVDHFIKHGTDNVSWFTISIFGLASLQFGYFAARTWLYYRRLKNNATSL